MSQDAVSTDGWSIETEKTQKLPFSMKKKV